MNLLAVPKKMFSFPLSVIMRHRRIMGASILNEMKKKYYMNEGEGIHRVFFTVHTFGIGLSIM